ncbi:MAG: LPS export ABC transporter periplasmic protein LptC [Chitinophagales bacterium]|nr:LPS export ABC transporter periplasmic protein LptC [Chitinophagales bacterium]
MTKHHPIAFLLFVLLTYLGAVSCKTDPKEIDALLNKSVQEDKAEDVTIIYSEKGTVKIRMFATEFIRNEVAKPPYTEMRKSLRIEFYNDSLKVESTLDAKYGRYYEEKGNVLIRDSVVVVNKNGDTLRTEELIWNQKIRQIYTEKFVRINTPDQVMYGDGLEANEDFSWYRIKNPKGVVKVNKEEVPE